MYAGPQYRQSYNGYGIPLVPVLSFISSLNPFKSGPDKGKWDARAKRVSANIKKAQAGDIKAWYALGAFGRPSVPLPIALNPPYTGDPRPAGFTVEEMGKDYNPLRDQARQAYDALTPMFQKMQQPPAGPGVIPITVTNPVSLPGVPPVSSTPLPFPGGSGPSFDPGNNLPVYAPDPTQGAIPATMATVVPTGGLSLPVLLALGTVGVVLALASQPRRNPPRRRAGRRRSRRR